MPLPSLEKSVLTFDITVPSSGAAVKFRPFLVKEEKLLLIALEADDEKTMLDAICQVLTGCAVSPLKVETLANFDIEYIFLKLRARSVGEMVEVSFRCQNEVELTPEEATRRRLKGTRKHPVGDAATASEDEPVVYSACGNVVKFSINLDTVEVQTDPKHNRQIMLTPTLGIMMRYPNSDMAKRLIQKGGRGKETVTDKLEGIAMCIESVFDAESVYSNFTPKEINEWLERLTQPQFVQVQEFFETMPKLVHDLEFKCDKCGHSEMMHLEGLAAFFG